MNAKEKKFLRGFCKSCWKKIQPRDWYYVNSKGREIGYGNFGNYINRLTDNELRYMFRNVSYNKNEDKKQCRKGGYLSDYYDSLFY